MKIPALLSLSVVNIMSVVVLPSLSRVAFNFVIMNFNYSYFFYFCGPAVTGSRCCGIPTTFSLLLCLITRMYLYYVGEDNKIK